MQRLKEALEISLLGVLILGGILSLGSCKSTSDLDLITERTVLMRAFLLDSEGSDPNSILYRPRTVRIDPEGNIVVLDEGDNRLIRYNQDGKFLQQIGGVGQGPGELLRPHDFDIDTDGRLYVTDTGNGRVSIFKHDGSFLKSFPLKRSQPSNILAIGYDEILLNQPTLDGALFDVYNMGGKKLRTIGVVDKFENPPFRGPNEIATQIFNKVNAFYDARTNEVNVFYIARPLYRRYSRNGELVFEKQIESAEINLIRKEERKKLEAHPPKTPNSGVSVNYFLDCCSFTPTNTCLVRLGSVGNYIYELDKRGRIRLKYNIRNAKEIKEEDPLIFRFVATGSGILVGSSPYYGTLYEIDIHQTAKDELYPI